MYDILELNKKLLPELREIAKGLQIKRVESLKKQDLIYKILDQQAIIDASSKKEAPKTAAPIISRILMTMISLNNANVLKRLLK
jgi:transcription termination factor Rho